MTAYLSIFQNAPIAILLLVAIATIPLLSARSTFLARSMLFATGPWLSPIFYLLYVFACQKYTYSILTALIIEAIILLCFLVLFAKLFNAVNDVHETVSAQLIKWLKIIIAIKTFIFIYFICQGGFGIFSQGSRIEYIEASRFNLSLTYFSYLLDAVSVPIVAAIINYGNKLNCFVIMYFLLVVANSVVSGSKGAAIMAFLAIISLIKLQSAKDYLKILTVPLGLILMAVGVTVFYVGQFLSLDPIQIISLMYYRIFLSNDARALAIDYIGLLDADKTTLFQESFRSLSSWLGYPPINLPLGQLLYQQEFNISGLLGGNTSSTALLISYGSWFEKIYFSFFICFVSYLITTIAQKEDNYKLPRLALGLAMLVFLSQDFLAFQLNTYILIAIIILKYFYISVRNTFTLRLSHNL
jgi:hypothetical protein